MEKSNTHLVDGFKNHPFEKKYDVPNWIISPDFGFPRTLDCFPGIRCVENPWKKSQDLSIKCLSQDFVTVGSMWIF